MRRSRGLVTGLVLAVTAGLGVTAAPPAAALTPPVEFTADNLPTWQTNGIVWALAHVGDTVFVGGTFSQVRPPESASGTPRAAVNFAALNAATGAPTSCELSFTVGSGTATVRALTVSPDQKTLYAAGYFGSVNGTPVSSVAAIDVATCTPRAGFHASFPATVRALAVTDDTVYAAGDFHTAGGQPRERFAAVDATTGALRPFVADADEPGRAIAVTPDGKHVVLGGDFFTVGGADSHALAVVDATTGHNVRTYPKGFIETNSVVKTIETDAGQFYTGNEGTGGGVFDGRIALDVDTLDQNWRDTCLGATQALRSYHGVLYSASHAHNCESMGEFTDGRRHHLMAEPTDDPTLLGWFPDTNDGLGESIGPRALTIADSGATHYLWVGGEFTTVNGGAAQGLTRFASGPDTGAPGVPQSLSVSAGPDGARLRWRSSTDLDDSRLTYRVYRDGSSTALGTVQGPDSFEWSRPQVSFTDSSALPGQTHSYRVTASDAAGNTSALSATVSVTVPASAEPYPDAVATGGATQYWRYDESATPFAPDSSPADHSGLYVNTPTPHQTPGAVAGSGGALTLNGTDQQVVSCCTAHLGSPYSVETWFRTSTKRGGTLVGFGSSSAGTGGTFRQQLYMADNGRLVFGTNTGTLRSIATDDAYNDNTWHHVLATQTATATALYVDGAKKASGTASVAQDHSGYWHVGGGNLSGWPQRPTSGYLAGQLDETAVYPKELTATDARDHFRLATAPVDTVSTVTASADTYVNAGAPNTAYGTSSSLAVRGSSAYETYLRFTLPSAPSGTVLKSARLAVKTSTQDGAESGDKVSVLPVTGSWTEAATTYATRPGTGTPALGTLGTVAGGSTVATATLSTSAVTAALGGSYDIALTGDGTDALWLWSREATASGGTPQLVLTFGAPSSG